MLEDFGDTQGAPDEPGGDEPGGGTAAPPVRRRRRGRRIALFAFASIILLVVALVAGYGAFLNHTVTKNIHHAALLPTPTKGQPTLTKDPAAGNAQNFLLLGTDERPGQGRQRSDVIMLVHVSSDRSTVHLIHFPRDLYVSIPGHGKDKINAAYAYGGVPLLVTTLEDLLDVPIDHVAVIGFEGFKRMTDAVGGVDVYAEEASNEPSGHIHQGVNHVDGAQALDFVRERHQLSEGDISRGRREQAFLKALMLKSLSKQTLGNPMTFATFVDAATKNLTVDDGFSVGDIRSEALALRNLRSSDIVFITAPFSGFGTSPVGGSIDIVDVPGMKRLSQALRTDRLSEIPASTQIP